MWPYLVTYELFDQECSAALSAVLTDLGAVHLLGKSWLLTSDWNASAVVEQLRPIIGHRGRLLIVELGEEVAALNLEEVTLASARLPRSIPASPKVQ